MTDTADVRTAEPTSEESAFFEAVVREVPEVQDWYHSDDGGLWMCVSLDLPRTAGSPIPSTSRCDYDGAALLGGRSPGFLNWDDGVRALAAEVDIDGPSGLTVRVSAPEVAAGVASVWFKARIAEAASN